MTSFVFIYLVLVTISTVISKDNMRQNGDIFRTMFGIISPGLDSDVIEKDDDFQCDEKNAIRTDCATNCELNRCPVTEHYSRICDKQKCAPGCQCRFNEMYAANGTCIPTQQCPPFQCDSRPNEKYDSCPSYCGDSCSQRNCPAFGVILMVVECFPACKCRQGFYRKAGICVPSEEC